MDWIALLKTLGLCLISIILEGLSATQAGKAWFEHLRQPKHSFSFSFWYVVGGLYYLLCGVIAYRQFQHAPGALPLSIVLLSAIMVLNGLTNFILFKFRSLRLFYGVLYPFIFLFVDLMYVLWPGDPVSVALAGVYLIWLLYDLYYFFNLWRLNGG